STKISEFTAAKTDKRYFDFAQEIRKRIEDLVRNPSWNNLKKSQNPELDFYKTLVEAVKKHRIANCGDMSKLCSLIANINGIPTQKAQMFTSINGAMGSFIDHAIQILPINGQKIEIGPLSKMKNMLIIDPWLGFADFAPKYERKIISDYYKFFGLKEDKTSIYLNPHCFREPEINEKIINYFRKHFPQFIINK
ncbi:MAG: hypothetical protein K2F57_04050, partial [Candidatus Gastranaerophilales bacterium]|nr:hypothetical protein [Candidatus Gastranaerophilales bacterium]